jgi:predicted ArsR family transcriptional regulator
MTYFNTTHRAGKELAEYKEKATSQEELILRYFLSRPKQFATPSKVLRRCFICHGQNVPITSVRRAMTNLTKSGDLVKTEHTMIGVFGRPEYFWQLAPKHRQKDLFQ